MKTSNSIDNPNDKKTQIKFRTSEFFNEALNSFWRHLRKDYPEKYGMVNSKGDLIVACILNDLNSTPKGKKMLNMYAEMTPEIKEWNSQESDFNEELEKQKKMIQETLKRRAKK